MLGVAHGEKFSLDLYFFKFNFYSYLHSIFAGSLFKKNWHVLFHYLFELCYSKFDPCTYSDDPVLIEKDPMAKCVYGIFSDSNFALPTRMHAAIIN